MTLAGLTSRWTIPLAWAAARPEAIWAAMRTASAIGEAAALDPPLERLPLAEGHGDEQPAVLRLVDLVDGADVGVIDRRGGAGLAQEPALVRLVGAAVGGEELEGDQPLELEVLRLVHDARTASTEAFEDPVAGDGAADQREGFLRYRSRGVYHFPGRRPGRDRDLRDGETPARKIGLFFSSLLSLVSLTSLFLSLRPPLFLEEGERPRSRGAGEVGGEDGDRPGALVQAVRRLGGPLDRQRGAVGELAGAGQPFRAAAVPVEVEQGVGAAGEAAAEGAVARPAPPRRSRRRPRRGRRSGDRPACGGPGSRG